MIENTEFVNLFLSKKHIWHISVKEFEKILSEYFEFLDPKFIWWERIDDSHIETFIDERVLNSSDPWNMANNPYYINLFRMLSDFQTTSKINQSLWPKKEKTKNKWKKIYKLMTKLDKEFSNENWRKPTYKDYADRLAKNNEYGYMGKPYNERLLREIRLAGISGFLN